MKNKTRKKWMIPILAITVLLASLLPNPLLPAPSAFASELGCTATVGGQWNEGWCEIDTAGELNAIRQVLDGQFRLTGHIDLGTHANWQPIGSQFDPFVGKLDGNGYTIRNLKIDGTANNVGLFDTLSTESWEAVIANVHLTDVEVSGVQYVGGLAGRANSPTLITASSVSGVVEAHGSAGLLVGYNQGTIQDSYTQGEVRISANAGPSYDSYGGLVGYNASSAFNPTNIYRSYTTASIIGTGTYAGAFIGSNVMGNVSDSFWNIETSGVSTPIGSGSASITPLSNEEMRNKSSYPGWHFQDSGVWNLIEGSTFPLHRERYRSVALSGLLVSGDSGDGAPLEWNTPFRPDLGVYTIKVSAQTENIEIAGTPMKPGSAVTGDGTMNLAFGRNEADITVTAEDGLSATYRLDILREEGTALHPHRIATAANLAEIGISPVYGMEDHYVLAADIDLSGYSAGEGWLPIGTAANPFKGKFDGNRHTLSNLTINRPHVSESIGLFAALENAEVSDLYLVRALVTGNERVGGLAGEAAGTRTSGIVVQGAVSGAGADKASGGLIGFVEDNGNATTVSFSYAAATGVTGGLIGVGAVPGTVTNSYWDIGVSGAAESSGGGAPATTEEMMRSGTFAGWMFDGSHWGIIEGASYPMPAVSLDGIRLSGISVEGGGTYITVEPPSGAGNAAYTATSVLPITQASVNVAPFDASATVSINGTQTASRDVNLDWGSNSVEIVITSPKGWHSVHRLAIVSPQPSPNGMSGPSAGWYGIGDELMFVVTYDSDVEVAGGTPGLRLSWSGSDSEATAQHDEDSSSNRDSIAFVYQVREGDSHTAGLIATDDKIEMPATTSIQANGQPVSLSLAGMAPDMTGVYLDGLKPTVQLTSASAQPATSGSVIHVDADGTGSAIAQLQWASGEFASASNFVSNASDKKEIQGHSFSVAKNGVYTVYAKDEAGNEQVASIAITAIAEPQAPYYPMLPVNEGSRFYIVPDKPYTLSLDGLKLHIPVGAIEKAMTITIKNISNASSGLFGAGQKPLSGVYEVSKNVPGKFLRPVELSLLLTETEWADGQKPVVAWYDEAKNEWIAIEDRLEADRVIGEIDHFTKFAVIAVAADENENENANENANEKPVFTDIKGHWSEQLLIEAAGEGVIGGYPDATFRPDQRITRAEYLTMLKGAFGWNGEGGYSFADGGDIPAWAVDAVRTAFQKGIITGYPDGTIRPSEAISREEAAVIAIRSSGLKPADAQSTTFGDDEIIGAWAKPYIQEAFEAGLVEGQGDNRFNPKGQMTRAEAAAMLLRMKRNLL